MEQQLINALMKLLSKAGGGSLIKDLIQQIDQNGNPKVWTPSEIEAAIHFVNTQIESFGPADARAMITSLQHKFNLDSDTSRDRSHPDSQALPEVPGVHGLR